MENLLLQVSKMEVKILSTCLSAIGNMIIEQINASNGIYNSDMIKFLEEGETFIGLMKKLEDIKDDFNSKTAVNNLLNQLNTESNGPVIITS